jgi:hypothetical protein
MGRYNLTQEEESGRHGECGGDDEDFAGHLPDERDEEQGAHCNLRFFLFVTFVYVVEGFTVRGQSNAWRLPKY